MQEKNSSHDVEGLHIPTADINCAVRYIISSPTFHHSINVVLNVLTHLVVPGLKFTDSDFSQRFLIASGAPRSGVCGVVWKRAEIAYKCRTCERDPTCVVCEQCFRHADHTGHDYAIIRTSGGCCDCGDPQAWAPSGFCSRHSGPSTESQDPTANLHPAFRTRLFNAVTAVACFILHHSVTAYYENSLSSTRSLQTQFPPRLTGFLLHWLAHLSQGDAVCRFIGEELCQPGAPWLRSTFHDSEVSKNLGISSDALDSHSWLSIMMQMEGFNQLPHAISSKTHALYFKLITDIVFKRKFFKIYISNYERYIHAQIARLYASKHNGQFDDSNGHADIIDNFSVQILTVPSLIPLMVSEDGMLDKVLSVLLNLFEMSSTPLGCYDSGIPYEQTAFAAKYPFAREEARNLSNSTDHFTTSLSVSQPGTSSNNRRLSSNLESRAALDVLSNFDAPQQTEGLSEPSDSNHHAPRQETPPHRNVSFPVIPQPAGQHAFFVNRNNDNLVVNDTMEAAENPGQVSAEPVSASDRSDSSDMSDSEDSDVMDESEAQSISDVEPYAMETEDDEEEEFIAMDENGAVHFFPENANPAVDVFLQIVNGRDENDLVVDRNFNEANQANQAFTFTISQRPSSDFYRHQVKVFEDGLSYTPLPNTRIVSENLGRTRFSIAVSAARKSVMSASNGSGLLTHSMRLDWSGNGKLDVNDVVRKVLSDLKYILNHKTAAFHFLHVRKDAFRKFVRILSMMQMMNATPRRFGEHDPVWSDVWSKLCTLEMEFCCILETCISALCVVNSKSHVVGDIDLSASRRQLICLVRASLDEWLYKEQASEALSTYKGEEFTVAHGQSIHIPLHRLLALLIHHTIRVDKVDVLSALLLPNESSKANNVNKVIQHPLRIQSFFAQARAGMWRRNGRPVVGQMYMYYVAFCSEWFVDLDLFLLQCGCLTLGANLFLSETLKAFRIADFSSLLDLALSNLDESQKSYAASNQETESDGQGSGHTDDRPGVITGHNNLTSGCIDEKLARSGFLPLAPRHLVVNGTIDEQSVVQGLGNSLSELVKFSQVIIEELLVFVVRVIAERSRCGFSAELLVKSRFIHELAVGDKPYTSMMKATLGRPLEATEEDEWLGDVNSESTLISIVEKTLNEIADHVRPKGMEQGFYRLKSSFWNEFDPFNPHLSRKERCSAEVRLATVCKNENRRLQPIPFYRVCDQPIYIQFENLYSLALAVCGNSSQSLSSILLEKCIPRNGIACSIGGFLGAALHLLCMTVEVGKSRTQQENLSLFVSGLVKEENCEKSSFGSVCELARIVKQSFPDLESEYGAVFERIIRGASKCSGDVLKPFIMAKVPHIVPPENEDGEGSEQVAPQTREQLRRKRMMRRKEQQAAAMALMLRAQSDFAKVISESETPKKEKDDCLIEDSNESLGEEHTGWKFEKECVLCHSSSDDSSTRTLGVVGFFQKSRLLEISAQTCATGHYTPKPRCPRDDDMVSQSGSVNTHAERNGGFVNKSSRELYAELSQQSLSECAIGEVGLLSSFGKNVIKFGIRNSVDMHINLCGHAVHTDCFQKYFASLTRNREHQGGFLGSDVVDLEKKEFLCPVCRRFSNLILPLVDEALAKSATEAAWGLCRSRTETRDSYGDWLTSRGQGIKSACEALKEPVSLSRASEGSSGRRREANSVVNNSDMKEVSKLVTDLSKAFHEGNVSEIRSDVERGVSVFETLAQFIRNVINTIACVEIASRSVKWDDSLLGMAKRSCCTLFRATREYIAMLESGCRLRALEVLWALATTNGYNSHRNGFVCLCLMLLLWPGRLVWTEMKMIVHLCFNIVTTESMRSGASSDALLNAVVYLRQAIVVSFAANVVEESCVQDLPHRYEREVSIHETRDEMFSLMKHFGIEGSDELWKHMTVNERCGEMSDRILLVPAKVGLIKLPRELDTLVEDSGQRKCSMCDVKTGKSWRMCLVCGEVVCEMKKCDAGGITEHMKVCSPAGVFLSIPRTFLEVVRENRRTQLGSPYLDAHGEEDAEMLRGKALFLCDERYSMVDRLWVLHAFDQDSYIMSHSQVTRRTRWRTILPNITQLVEEEMEPEDADVIDDGT